MPQGAQGAVWLKWGCQCYNNKGLNAAQSWNEGMSSFFIRGPSGKTPAWPPPWFDIVRTGAKNLIKLIWISDL